MSSVHRIKLLILGLLLFPAALFAQTSTTGRIDEGPLAARPTVCTPGDYYVSNDTNPVVEYKCSTGNTWTPEATGGGGGSPPGAPLNSPQCNSLGTGFKACSLNNEILYVSTTGNDANNGTSWDTAKLTIMAAVCALPTGNCSTTPKQAGAGTVQFTDGVNCNSVAAAGCWIAGPGDSQYPNMTSSTSGPTAWTIELNNPYPAINFICSTGPNGAPTGNRPTCNVNGPNHTVGTNLPIFWATGTSLGSFYIYGMSGGQFAGGVFSASWGRIGIDSATGQIINPVQTQTNSYTIENVNTGNISGGGAPGVGPQIAVGNGFHMHFRDITTNGNNGESCNVAAATRTSGVVTLTTSNCGTGAQPTQCPFLVGDHLSIRDTGGDGTFNGTFTATSACGATNTVTFNQAGPNSSVSVGTSGVISSDRAFGIACYLCAVTEMRQLAFNGNGIKLYTGPSTTFQINDVYTEGGGVLTQPQLWISPLIGGGGGQVDVGNFNLADTPLIPSIINEGGPLMFVHTEQSTTTNIRGPMIVLGGNDSSYRTTGLLASGQSGWLNNTYFEANTDISRRQAPVTANIFGNMATQNPSGWGGSSYTTASGKRDPFGGTGAIEIDATATTNVLFYNLSTSVNVNDILVFGAWVRELTPTAGSQPIGISLNGGPTGALCYGDVGQVTAFTPFIGDGNWYWLTGTCTIWQNTPTPTVQFFAAVDSTHALQVYRPFIFKVASGTVSATELADEINSIGFGPSTAAGAGDIVIPADKKICGSSGSAANEFCEYLVHANTVNRTTTFPDVSGIAPLSSNNPLTSLTGQPLIAVNANPAAFTSPGIADGNGGVPVTTTPYAVKCDSATTLLDRGHLIRFQSGASVVTVPLSTASGCLGGFVFTVVDESAGALTFNSTSPDTFSVYNGGSGPPLGSSSFSLSNGQFATLSQGASGIWEVRITGAGVGAGASPLTATFYFSPSCPAANTGGCINTFADTQEADTCSWASTGPDVNCYSQIPNISGSVTSNVVTYKPIITTTLQSVPSAWAIGNSITVSGFTGGDSYLNQTCTLTATTTTSFSCALTHANASSSTPGTVYNTNVGPFVVTDVGKSVMGARTCQAFQGNTIYTQGIISTSGVPTIASFINSTHVTLSANPANSQAVVPAYPGAGGCFIWGHPDDAAAVTLENAYTFSPQCPKIEMAAGYYMFSQIHFTSQPFACVHEPVGVTDTAPGGPAGFYGNVFYSSGVEFEGRGAGATIWYLLPNFPNGTSWTNGVNSAAAFVIPPEGRWHNFQISGGYQSNPANFPNGGELIYASVASIDNFVCTNFGAFSTNLSIGLRADWQVQGYQYVNSGCGSIGIATVSLHGQVTCIKCSVENSWINGVNVGQSNGNIASFDFACYDCKFFNSQATTFAAQPPIIVQNSGGRVFLEHTVITTGTNTTGTQMVGYKQQTNSGGVLQLKDSYVAFNTSDPSNIAIWQAAAGTVYMQNNLFQGGSAGEDYQDVSGAVLVDEGGNSSVTAAQRYSISGRVVGESISFGQAAAVTAPKLVLSAGWGSTAAVTSVTGGNAPIQFTITNSGTGQGASPTITYTFPNPWPVAPFSCTATQTGGTNTVGTFTSSSLSTTGVTFTFSLTPTASSTEIVQVTCVTP